MKKRKPGLCEALGSWPTLGSLGFRVGVGLILGDLEGFILGGGWKMELLLCLLSACLHGLQFTWGEQSHFDWEDSGSVGELGDVNAKMEWNWGGLQAFSGRRGGVGLFVSR